MLTWKRFAPLVVGGTPDFTPDVRFAQAQDGAYGTPTDLATDTDRAVARIGGGRVVTAFSDPVRAAVGAAGAPPGPPVVLSADDRADVLKLAVAADGSAMLVYRTTSLGLRMVRLRR